MSSTSGQPRNRGGGGGGGGGGHRPRRPVIALEPLESRRLLAATLLDNIAVTSDPGVQHQPSLAVDPRAPQRVVTAYMDYSLRDTGYAGIGVATSNDGGGTWRHTSIPLPAGYEQGAANPIAKFDGDGRLFVSFMAVTFLGDKPPITQPSGTIPDSGGVQFRTLGFTSNNGIFVARSDDGGLNFQPAVALATHRYDGTTPVPFDIAPDIAIDTSRTSPNYGNVYVVWTRYYPPKQFPDQPASTGGSLMQMSASTDGGQTFAARPPIRDTFASGIGPPAGLGNAVFPKASVGPGGEVYVAYYDFGNFIVLHSTDAGNSFDDEDVDVGAARHVAFRPDGNSNANTAGGPLHALRYFRTQTLRGVIADPTRPGRLYVAEPTRVLNEGGREIDTGDLYFARSDDHGVTWQTLQVSGADGVINDDNGGARYTGAADDEVSSRQFFLRLAIDDDGTLAAIWYDTRRDPRNREIDVFAAVSTDGGASFGPNFRVTNRTFNVEAGEFTNARGEVSYYLGDFLGLHVDSGRAYAAWTDTRTGSGEKGNQDIFFAGFPVAPPPPAPNDRFEPNDRGATGTSLDPIVHRVLPRLSMGPGDRDVFNFQTRATGLLVIEARQALRGSNLKLELVADGVVVGAGSPMTDARNRVVGQKLAIPSKTLTQYSLRVSSSSAVTTPYTLDIQALTADLGAVAYRAIGGTIEPRDENLFLVSASANGSMSVKLTGGDPVGRTLVLKLLDAANPDPASPLAIADESGLATLNVIKGQRLLAQVTGADPDASGRYAIAVTNLDSFSTPDRASMLFPAGAGPSQVELGDLNGDAFDDLVVTNALSQTLSVLLANGDGTFQAPRQFDVGAFFAGGRDKLIPLNLFRRDLELADFDNDGNLDAAVTNNDSADVSILLGRGDGTFAPQRRFDATTLPFALDSGDLNNDGVADLAVIDVSPDVLRMSVLLGRGDGTFRRQTFIPTGLAGALGNSVSDVQIADVDNDGNADLLYTGGKNQRTYVLLGRGDGSTFVKPTFTYRINGGVGPLKTLVFDSFDGGGPEFQVVDLNGDGFLDVVNVSVYNNRTSYVLGNGNGTFAPQTTFFGGQAPVAVRVADIATLNADGTVTLGSGDGVLDIITAGSGTSLAVFQGEPEITVAAGYIGRRGLRYVRPVRLAAGAIPISLAVGNVNADAKPDVAFVDEEGVRVIANQAPDAPREAVRNLGTVVHLLQPTLTITPGRSDAWYELTLPTEAAHGAGHEVMDIRAVFENAGGAGLDMEVLDADTGALLGTGPHARISAAQGRKLRVHVFGKTDDAGVRGTGAYTLDIAALPQLISVEANPLLPGVDARPGGPTASIVLTFQGDRLDEAQAEDASNYRVVFLGADGAREIGIGAAGGAQAVVYNPSANVDVTSGKTYPTAVRQTVTLLFDQPLPAGSYRVEVSPRVGAAPFNEGETAVIGQGKQPVVSRRDGGIAEGAAFVAADLVSAAAGGLGDLAVFERGTPFLSQLHGDLGALLDRALGAAGDQAGITDDILRHLRARLQAELGRAGAAGVPIVALFLDPVGIDLQDPSGERITYDLASGALDNSIANAFVSVASNVELIIVPMSAAGQLTLNVDDVPATARGGAVLLGPDGDAMLSFTESMRDGQRSFTFGFGGGNELDLPEAEDAVATRTSALTETAGLTGSDEVVTFAPISTGSSRSAFAAADAATAAATPFADVQFAQLQTFDGIERDGGGGAVRPADGRVDEANNQRLFRWWAELNRRLGLTLPWLTQPSSSSPSSPASRIPEPQPEPQPQPEQQPRPQRTTEAQPPPPPQQQPPPPPPPPRDQVRRDAPSGPVSQTDDHVHNRPYASLALLPVWLCRRTLARRRLRRRRRGEEGDA